jgi:hypothetical protein
MEEHISYGRIMIMNIAFTRRIGIGLLSVVCCFGTLAAETGDLKIVCDPGIRIYFDDQLAGVTTEQDGGLLIHGISPGVHKIRGENTEFMPSEFETSIMAGKMTQIKIGEDGAPMVLIPAGEFQMGSNDKDSDPNERPLHSVYVDAFYIDKYEVT